MTSFKQTLTEDLSLENDEKIILLNDDFCPNHQYAFWSKGLAFILRKKDTEIHVTAKGDTYFDVYNYRTDTYDNVEDSDDPLSNNKFKMDFGDIYPTDMEVEYGIAEGLLSIECDRTFQVTSLLKRLDEETIISVPFSKNEFEIKSTYLSEAILCAANLLRKEETVTK